MNTTDSNKDELNISRAAGEEIAEEEVAEEEVAGEEETDSYMDWTGWTYDAELREVIQHTDGESIIPICKVYSPDDVKQGSELLSDEDSRENARLITHAPDMLGMLEYLVNNHLISEPDVVEDITNLLSLIKRHRAY